MFCQQCGTEMTNGASFCSHCGTNQVSPVLQASGNVVSKSPTKMTFSQAMASCMKNYFNFKGRASLSEFWWFYVFGMVLSFSSAALHPYISMLITLVFLMPSLTVTVRRLHDTNRSGWWILLSLTIIGTIPLLIWLVSKGTEQGNTYGEQHL
ncbi:DUF805 domain-containing protein [Aeromonas veronii]|uniref:DUF805 domain-containing protein n=1 Tax=Aeromonas veronii TaxID=654 RepID=UPI003D194580